MSDNPSAFPTERKVEPPDDYDDHGDDSCYECGGEGFVSICMTEYECIDPEYGCDLCTRPCDVCNRPARTGDA